MAEEFEACTTEHVSFDLFRLRVDAFRPAVVVRERDRGGGGLDVEFEPPGERVQVRQVSGPRGGDPPLQVLLVGRAGDQHRGEGADMGPEGGTAGGTIIATGSPEDVAANDKSYTGQFLKPLLSK